MGVKCNISATIDLHEALQNANFCIISIEVGDRFKLWDQDWKIPQQYGMKQIYAENGGPGGLFHSLRIIPPILDICDDIVKACGLCRRSGAKSTPPRVPEAKTKNHGKTPPPS